MTTPTFEQDCHVLVEALYNNLSTDEEQYPIEAWLSVPLGSNSALLPEVMYIDTSSGESIGSRPVYEHVNAFADMLGLIDGPDLNNILINSIYGALAARIHRTRSDMYIEALDKGLFGRGYVMKNKEVQA